MLTGPSDSQRNTEKPIVSSGSRFAFPILSLVPLTLFGATSSSASVHPPDPKPELRSSPSGRIISTLAQHKKIKKKRYITFLGYSAAGYETPEAVDCHIKHILTAAGCQADNCEILVGSTEGITRVTDIAKPLGIETSLVMSEIGAEYLPESKKADYNQIYLIKDHLWGGHTEPKIKKNSSKLDLTVKSNRTAPAFWDILKKSKEELRRIAPTSKALLRPSDLIVMIGGGPIGQQEMQICRHLNKPVIYVPAKFDQTKVVEAYKKSGKTAPEILNDEDLYGAVYQMIKKKKQPNVTPVNDYYQLKGLKDDCSSPDDKKALKKIADHLALPFQFQEKPEEHDQSPPESPRSPRPLMHFD